MNNCRRDNCKNPDILRHGYTGMPIVRAVLAALLLSCCTSIDEPVEDAWLPRRDSNVPSGKQIDIY